MFLLFASTLRYVYLCPISSEFGPKVTHWLTVTMHYAVRFTVYVRAVPGLRTIELPVPSYFIIVSL